MSIPEDAITRRPSFRLAVLGASPEALESFKGALDWFCETVRSHAEGRTSAHMTMRKAEEFIASVPWRQVKDEPVMTPERVAQGWAETAPDPHQYVIKDWREVDINSFDAFVRLIKAEGYRATYRAPYRPHYVMMNHYLEIDGWCYWFIRPKHAQPGAGRASQARADTPLDGTLARCRRTSRTQAR